MTTEKEPEPTPEQSAEAVLQRYDIPASFRKRFRKKPPAMQGAILRCIKLLETEPTRPGLGVHQIGGRAGVWEAKVDEANRVTFRRPGEGRIELLNHCNHTIVDRA